ncbi:sulfatase [Brachybacterium fresconis]|uniref:Arylsulfatase A-like enzyme n=1 Tax=Brachybacterium fresconis TaxID=173363 RepID=A0ABS4YFI8_9MICO|nr:sulfatase [Brachybacterium fresconis]MBP2407566.1 arylsulfatase A-like enzyme [Brachybacterium fresconis]
MKAIILMFDSLNRHMLEQYRDTIVEAPNFARLAEKVVTFDNFYAGSMPCMPARREMHTGRYNFLHRSWGPLEPFDDSMPQILKEHGIHTHLASDHPHYWEDGGATYHTRYSTWEFFRGQEGDPWKGVVASDARDTPLGQQMVHQDRVNRSYMPTESEHSQTRTVDAGLHFVETNAATDDWMVQIELFDPHEPFFTHQHYKDLYPHEYDGPEFDWPGYQKVTQPEAQVEHARREYAALVIMCDRSLGRVLDAMDEQGLWDDTMLIVNTDHGFLLGEHGWWAKSVQPWFNELVHLPMFLWDPRSGAADIRRGDLAQTIDIAPTLLRYFGIEPTPDMQGTDLGVAPSDASAGTTRPALFGIYGGHVNITDGRYVYMRSASAPENGPLEEFTLMPTHMRSRFSPAELQDWIPAEPFTFTKGLRTIRVEAQGGWMNSWQHGSVLFDLEADPEQLDPLQDDEVELRMTKMLVEAMRSNEAPRSQFERLGLPAEGEVSPEHLLVRRHAGRVQDMAVPMPRLEDLPAAGLLTGPLLDLAGTTRGRAALEAEASSVMATEAVSVPPGMSLYDLAAHGAISVDQLRRVGEALVSA